MDKNLSFIRISELIKMAKRSSAQPEGKSNRALELIAEVFHSIDAMTNDEREDVMKRLTGWMLVEKFEAKGYPALMGFQRYCIADCLSEDPTWVPPRGTIATKVHTGQE